MPQYITKDDLMSTGHNLSQFTDDEIDKIIEKASSVADYHCRQPLGLTTSVENISLSNYSGLENIKLFTKYLPVNKINNIKVYSSLKSFSELDVDNCYIDNILGYIEIPITRAHHVAINYDHGYEIIPDVAIMAIIDIAKAIMDQSMAAKLTGFSDVIQIQEFNEKVIRKTSDAKIQLNGFRKVR